jgi:hypothetical protein
VWTTIVYWLCQFGNYGKLAITKSTFNGRGFQGDLEMYILLKAIII